MPVNSSRASRHVRLVAHFYTHVGFALRAEIFFEGRQRDNHNRVETKKPEERALAGECSDHFKGVAIDQDLFVERASAGKKRVGHVIADHAHLRTTARFQVVKEATFAAVEGRDQGVVGRGAEDEDVLHTVVSRFHAAQQAHCRHGDHEVGVGRRGNRVVDLLRIFGADFFAVAVVPPVVHPRPGPLRNVEHVVAYHGHAFVKAGRDAINRGAHQGDGHDADDHTERSQHGARLVRRHLRGGDLPALSQLIKKALHDFPNDSTATARGAGGGGTAASSSLSTTPSRRCTLRRA